MAWPAVALFAVDTLFVVLILFYFLKEGRYRRRPRPERIGPVVNSTGQDRQSGSESRWGLQAWGLWTLASAVGDTAGGATSEVEFIGPIFLFGVILGAAQALVLRRYLRGTIGRWVLASFLGWLTGWLVFALVAKALTALVLGIGQQAGSPIVIAGYYVAGTSLMQFVVWAVFGAFQATTLALGRRASPSLGALWAAAGTLGGMLAVVAGLAFNVGMLTLGSEGLFLDWIFTPPLREPLREAAGGALYGAATGVVLAVVVRRGDPEDTRRPGRRNPGWLATAAGLVALLALGTAAGLGFGGCSGSDCRGEDRAIYEEFPQYGGQDVELGPAGPGANCNARFPSTAPREEVLTYYSERLRENGWEVEVIGANLYGRRDGYAYRVEHGGPTGPTTTRDGGLEEDFVEVRISRDRGDQKSRKPFESTTS